MVDNDLACDQYPYPRSGASQGLFLHRNGNPLMTGEDSR